LLLNFVVVILTIALKITVTNDVTPHNLRES